MIFLQNNNFQISQDETTNSFSFIVVDDYQFSLEKFNLLIEYIDKNGGVKRWTPSHWQLTPNTKSHRSIPGVGKGKEFEFTSADNTSSVLTILSIFAVDNAPLILWKMKVINTTESPINIRKIYLIHPNENQRSMFNSTSKKGLENFQVFTNGWQSWSFSAGYGLSQKQRHSRLGFFQNPMIVNSGTPFPKNSGHFTSDFFLVISDKVAEKGLLIGFLSQQQQFGSIEINLKDGFLIKMWANGDDVRLDPMASIETDWAVYSTFNGTDSECIKTYLDIVAGFHNIHVHENVPVGWCSWYRYYQNISEEAIQNNLNTINALRNTLPINLVQIDDGFQLQVGDWLQFHENFPNGVSPLASKITNEGFIPGLWLAPFIVHRRSQLYHQHPDWILRTVHNQPVNAGFVWNSLGTALDLTNEDAMSYICQVMHKTVHEWGFPYLKLDFLYAAALKGKYQNNTKTRAQVLRSSMQAIRDEVGKDVFLLGCGAPLGSMLGLVDAMRIGADVSRNWTPEFLGINYPFKKEPSMPSARNSMHNAITRANLHKRWWVNDADCLLIGSDTNLTQAEIQSLATVIALTGGSIILSDDLTALTKEQIELAAALLPPIGKRAIVVDWLDKHMPSKLRLGLNNTDENWYLIAKFNWEDRPVGYAFSPEDFYLPKNTYWVSDFWDRSSIPFTFGTEPLQTQIPAHGVKLLAIRQRKRNQHQILGSTFHISQGLEVSNFQYSEKSVKVHFDIGRKAMGTCWFYLPKSVQSVEMDKGSIQWKMLQNSVAEIQLDIDKKAYLNIFLK